MADCRRRFRGNPAGLPDLHRHAFDLRRDPLPEFCARALDQNQDTGTPGAASLRSAHYPRHPHETVVVTLENLSHAGGQSGILLVGPGAMRQQREAQDQAETPRPQPRNHFLRCRLP